jgi:transcriptional regulator with XRE-family HTH domain
VQQIETGRFVPSSQTLGRIAAALGLRRSELEAGATRRKLPEMALALRKHRGAAGLSRFDLAVRAHVTESYVTAIETGRRRPSADAIARLASALGITMGALAGGAAGSTNSGQEASASLSSSARADARGQ